MASSDGKKTEKKVTEYLKKLMEHPEWWFHRFPDAAVCKGRIPKQPADYLVMYDGVSVLMEVKESESLTSIPKSRLTQTPKMKRFTMAGGVGLFLVSHPKHDWGWRFFEVYDVDKAEGASVKLKDLVLYPNLSLVFAVIKQHWLLHGG